MHLDIGVYDDRNEYDALTISAHVATPSVELVRFFLQTNALGRRPLLNTAEQRIQHGFAQ